jgi:hypothetical protein
VASSNQPRYLSRFDSYSLLNAGWRGGFIGPAHY